MFWVGITANFQTLLQIWCRASDLVNLGDVFQLGDLFTTWRGVAAVGFRRGPAQLHLGVSVESEEIGGAGESPTEDIDRDWVVLEVYEACGLEAMEDSLGSSFSLIRGSGKEFGKVYELEQSSVCKKEPSVAAERSRWRSGDATKRIALPLTGMTRPSLATAASVAISFIKKMMRHDKN